MNIKIATPKGIMGDGTPDSPFIIPDNRLDLTKQEIADILAYEAFCTEKYNEVNKWMYDG